jgi:chromosome segregation ATPase
MDDVFVGNTPYLPVPADHIQPPLVSPFRAFPPAPASHAEIFKGWKGRARGFASTPPEPNESVPELVSEMSQTLTLSHLDSSQPAALSAARTLERARDTVRVLKEDLATERSQRAQVAAQLQANQSSLATQQSQLAESQRTVAELNEKVTFLQRSLEDNERSRQSLLKAARRQRERADQAESEMAKLQAQHEEHRQQWSVEAETKLGDVAARWQEAMHNERIQFDAEREQDRRVLDDASTAIEHVQLQIAGKDQAILDAVLFYIHTYASIFHVE